jgi:hypothetical protein
MSVSTGATIAGITIDTATMAVIMTVITGATTTTIESAPQPA